MTNNTIIDEEIDYWNKYGAGFYPSIVINNVTYRGQLDPPLVETAICAGFKDQPESCVGKTDLAKAKKRQEDLEVKNNTGTITGGDIVGIIFMLIIINLIGVYCYRRHAKKEMHGDM